MGFARRLFGGCGRSQFESGESHRTILIPFVTFGFLLSGYGQKLAGVLQNGGEVTQESSKTK